MKSLSIESFQLCQFVEFCQHNSHTSQLFNDFSRAACVVRFSVTGPTKQTGDGEKVIKCQNTWKACLKNAAEDPISEAQEINLEEGKLRELEDPKSLECV